MKTDVTLDNPAEHRRVVIETKFTDALVTGESKTTVDSKYLYQLYTYLASQTGQGNNLANNAEGVLLFVKTADRPDFDEETKIQGHRMRFLSVDLGATPAEIRARWLECVAPHHAGAVQ